MRCDALSITLSSKLTECNNKYSYQLLQFPICADDYYFVSKCNHKHSTIINMNKSQESQHTIHECHIHMFFALDTDNCVIKTY